MVSAKARASEHVGLSPNQNKTRTNIGRAGIYSSILAHLPADGYRYPVGNATGRQQLFCGRPAPSGPYCAACAPRTRIPGSGMSRDEAAYWAAVAEGRR